MEALQDPPCGQEFPPEGSSSLLVVEEGVGVGMGVGSVVGTLYSNLSQRVRVGWLHHHTWPVSPGTSGNHVLPAVCARQDSTRKSYRDCGKIEGTHERTPAGQRGR